MATPTDKTERLLFKDVFSELSARRLENELRALLPEPYPSELLVLGDTLTEGFLSLELMDRSRLVTRNLCSILPDDPHESFRILVELSTRWSSYSSANLNPVSGSGSGEALSAFWIMAMIDCVPEIWLSKGDVPMDLCLETLRTMTLFFSAEFAIRPFLRDEPETVLIYLIDWTRDPSPAVRRLVSEGTRPRLPWGIRLPYFIQHPKKLIPLLEALKDDPDEVVRRSVANNINDIAKDHPQLVVELLNRWQENTRTQFIRHAGRTLIKKGNTGMLAILGYNDIPNIDVVVHEPEPKIVPKNEKVQVTWTIKNLETETKKVLLDYRIWFMKANGTQNAKVFKGSETSIPGGGTFIFSRSFSFRPITTRTYYPGEHLAEILVNGKVFGKVMWIYEG